MAKKFSDIEKQARKLAKKRFPDADMDELFVHSWIARKIKQLNNEAAAKMPPPSVSQSGLDNCPCNTTDTGLGDKIVDTGEIVPEGRVDKHWQAEFGDLLEYSPDKEPRNERYYHEPEAFRERFGLKSVEFGNWMTQADRAKHLYACASAFRDLAKCLNINHSQIGFGGRLSIAFGARGISKAMGHYEPTGNWVINLTKTAGHLGVLAHEYGHAIDNFAAVDQNLKYPYVSNGGSKKRVDLKADENGSDVEKFFYALFVNDRKTASAFTEYLKEQSDYTRSRVEIWARTFELFVKKRLAGLGIKNRFLSIAAYGTSGNYDYPSEVTFLRALPAMERIIASAFDNLPKSSPRGELPATGKPDEKPDTKPEATTEPDEKLQKTSIETRSKAIPAVYRVVELDDLIASHNEQNFAADKRYPTGCQQRDYTNDKAEQQKVIKNAMHFNPRFLVADAPTATDGAPIVTPASDSEKKYVVLGGNSRTMSLKRLTDYKIYAEYLERAASIFGYTAEYIRTFKKPVLIREVQIDFRECALYSNILNKSLTQDVDKTTENVSLARQITDEQLKTIAEVFESAGVETIGEAMNDAKTVRRLLDILRAAGVVNDQNVSTYIDPATNALSASGKLTVEGVLLGAILPDKRVIDSARNYTGAILRALPLLVRMKAMPPEWNIIQDIQDVIKLEAARRATKADKWLFIKQERIGEPAIPRRHVIIWEALDGGVHKFRQFLTTYITQAEREIERGGGNSMFAFEPQSPDDVIEIAAGVKSGGLNDNLHTTSDVLSIRPERIFLARLGGFLGQIVTPFSMTIWGVQGSGKSTLKYLLIDDLDKHGKVLDVLTEENYRSGRVAERMRLITAFLRQTLVADHFTLDDIRQFLRKNTDFKTIVIDSVNELYSSNGHATEAEVLALKKEFPDVNWVYILQANKDGKEHRGFPKIQYLVDIEVYVENGVATTKKNRDGESRRTLRVFPGTASRGTARDSLVGL